MISFFRYTAKNHGTTSAPPARFCRPALFSGKPPDVRHGVSRSALPRMPVRRLHFALLLLCSVFTAFLLFPFSPVCRASELSDLSVFAAEEGATLSSLGSDLLSLTPDGERSQTVAALCVYRQPPDLFYTEALSMPFYCTDADGEYLASRVITVTLTFTDGESLSASALSSGDGAANLVADLTGLSGTRLLSMVRVSFRFPSAADDERCVFGALRTDREASSELAERFFCASFDAHLASVIYAGDGRSLSAHFYGSGAYLEGLTLTRVLQSETNSLRFAVASASRSTELLVYYSYESDGGFTEENCVTLPIERSESEITYTLHVPDAGSVKRLRICSTAAGMTTIRLNSLLAVSAYTVAGDKLGTVSSCELSDDGKSIVIRGSIPPAAAVSYRDCTLALYSLSGIETIGAAVTGSTPIQTADISTRFEFKIPVTNAEDDALYNKYALTLWRDGAPLEPAVFIDTPCFVGNLSALSASAVTAGGTASGGFKGVLLSGTEDAGVVSPQTTVLDVDFSRLFDRRGSGYAFRYAGSYYYFSREYSDRLQEKLSACDAQYGVMLRLLASNPGETVAYTYSYNESGVFFYGLNASTAEARRCISAAVTYLCSLGDRESPMFSGIIVGRNADNGGEYNFISADMPLDDYAERYLLALRAVFASASLCADGITVYAAAGDAWESDAVGRRFLFPRYDTAMLLEALCARAEDECGGINLSLVFESDASPAGVTPAECDIFNLSQVTPFITGLAEKYGVTPATPPVLVWSPSALNTVCRDYAALYYTITESKSAKCLLLDLSLLSAMPDSGALELIALMRGIDTVQTLNVTAALFAGAGVTDVSLLYPDFDGSLLVQRDVRHSSFSATGLPSVTGRVVYRDFTGRGSYAGLLPCSSAVTVSYSGSAALCSFAGLRAAEDNSVILPLNGEDLASAETLRLEVRGEFEGERTLTVELYGGGVTCVFSGALQSGGRRTLYADVSGNEGLKNAEYMRVTLSGQGGLYIYRIGGESASLTDRQLESIRQSSATRGTDASDSFLIWGGVLLCVALVSAVSAVSVRRRRQ